MSGHVSDEQLSLLVDSRLSLAAREAVIGHVRSCPACAERHDRLIETTATLRTAASLTWSEVHTDATLVRMRARPGPRLRIGRRLPVGDWSLPLAAAVAVAGVVALFLAPLGLGSTIVAAPRSAGSVLSLAFPISGRVLAFLAGAVALGCLAYPLSRSR